MALPCDFWSFPALTATDSSPTWPRTQLRQRPNLSRALEGFWQLHYKCKQLQDLGKYHQRSENCSTELTSWTDTDRRSSAIFAKAFSKTCFAIYTLAWKDLAEFSEVQRLRQFQPPGFLQLPGHGFNSFMVSTVLWCCFRSFRSVTTDLQHEFLFLDLHVAVNRCAWFCSSLLILQYFAFAFASEIFILPLVDFATPKDADAADADAADSAAGAMPCYAISVGCLLHNSCLLRVHSKYLEIWKTLFGNCSILGAGFGPAFLSGEWLEAKWSKILKWWRETVPGF